MLPPLCCPAASCLPSRRRRRRRRLRRSARRLLPRLRRRARPRRRSSKLEAVQKLNELRPMVLLRLLNCSKNPPSVRDPAVSVCFLLSNLGEGLESVLTLPSLSSPLAIGSAITHTHTHTHITSSAAELAKIDRTGTALNSSSKFFFGNGLSPSDLGNLFSADVTARAK
eukprot:COSAG05_NODE_221_length_13654_cov_29.450103_6_plen_169_part_00